MQARYRRHTSVWRLTNGAATKRIKSQCAETSGGPTAVGNHTAAAKCDVVRCNGSALTKVTSWPR